MLSTKEEILNDEIKENVLTFYEKIKIKNNIESIFNHYTGSYVFIEVNPWTDEYTVRGKFHVKYGIFSKFELHFEGIESLRNYSEFIESLAFIKNTCEENILPVLNANNELVFLHNGEYITQENIEGTLTKIKESRKSELFNINEEIKKIYNEIEEVDNNIKDKKDQIKKMESEIREVKDAAASFMSAFKYITFVSKNSILNRFKNIFKKDQLKLAETNNN